LAWFRTAVWKLAGMRKGFEKGRCPLYSKNEDAVDMETRNWREHLLS
jgi:hypothetical protein